MKKTFGKYVLPTVERLDIDVEQGFASSIIDAGNDDYDIIGFELDEPLFEFEDIIM